MKTVYEAANSVDAHIVLNMLRARGFEGEVSGDFLQSGAGELQAFGAVSVWVVDEDYEAARKVVLDWQSSAAS